MKTITFSTQQLSLIIDALSQYNGDKSQFDTILNQPTHISLKEMMEEVIENKEEDIIYDFTA